MQLIAFILSIRWMSEEWNSFYPTKLKVVIACMPFSNKLWHVQSFQVTSSEWCTCIYWTLDHKPEKQIWCVIDDTCNWRTIFFSSPQKHLLWVLTRILHENRCRGYSLELPRICCWCSLELASPQWGPTANILIAKLEKLCLNYHQIPTLCVSLGQPYKPW